MPENNLDLIPQIDTGTSTTNNSQQNKKKYLFINHVSNEGKRLITVIGSYPFYQSTGLNSSSRWTFFPFGGMGFRGWFIKPDNEISPPYFPKQLADFINNNLPENRSFYKRFGNLETMLISYLMGGGFWSTNVGLLLVAFLEKNFEREIVFLRDKHQDYFNYFKQLNKDVDVDDYRVGNKNVFNTLLDEYSNILNLNEHQCPQYIDYSTYSVVDNKELSAMNMALSITQLCNDYLIHLNGLKEQDESVQNKRLAIELMLDKLSDKTISSSQKKLQNANEIYQQHKSMLFENRDPIGTLILKGIGHILSLFLISLATKGTVAFWKSHSQVLAENIEPMLDAVDSSLRSCKSG